MRAARRKHVAGLPASTSALMFLRPPAAVANLAPEVSTVGLYHAHGSEAPTAAYARWFYENGRHLALPWFASRGAPMRFRRWHNPFDAGELAPGPFGGMQPRADADDADGPDGANPTLVIVPLIAFTAGCDRLGQGGGHYDRWLAAHPDVTAIGLAWDCQLVAALPVEDHDCTLDAVVTPTRLFEGER